MDHLHYDRGIASPSPTWTTSTAVQVSLANPNTAQHERGVARLASALRAAPLQGQEPAAPGSRGAAQESLMDGLYRLQQLRQEYDETARCGVRNATSGSRPPDEAVCRLLHDVVQ